MISISYVWFFLYVRIEYVRNVSIYRALIFDARVESAYFVFFGDDFLVKLQTKWTERALSDW